MIKLYSKISSSLILETNLEEKSKSTVGKVTTSRNLQMSELGEVWIF